MTISYEEVRNFLYAEARSLDDKQWDQWLEFYSKDAEFWMPSWDDDGELTTDPRKEISLIYYARRDGLEDRVFRIKTERSSASSLPEPRTLHLIGNIEVLNASESDCEVRYNWQTNSYRYQTTDSYYGVTHLTLVRDDAGELKIRRKKVVLKNDCIHHVVDVYHL
ncbi:benzoate 1,2-dioxygenase small subunit [Marinobacterium aestuariivivens]|uniref:Benzoate 1,2-dioxygenase small subunit n=1 Tax=Marinobacterium aestuariivivens TaxID=1698799 RepID=A0ABW1ZU41_9GAMM